MRAMLQRRRSLRAYLVALVAAALVPLLAFSAGMIFYSWALERRAIERRLHDSAVALRLAVDRELEITVAALTVLAQSTSLRAGDLPAFETNAQAALRANARWASVVLIDATGQQLINLAMPPGAALPKVDDPEFDRVIHSRHPTITPLTWGPVLGRRVIVVSVPVLRGHRIGYLLSAVIAADAFAALLREQDLPEGWNADIVDQHNVFVARTRNAANFVGQRVSSWCDRSIATGTEGLVRGRNREGVDVEVAFSRSPYSSWTVGLAVPAVIVSRPIRDRLGWLGAGAVLCLGLAGGLATLVARRISGPIGSLVTAAEAVGRGEPVKPGTGAGLLETLALGRAFATAAGALRERAVEREQRLLAEVRQEHAEATVAALRESENALRCAEERLRFALASAMAGPGTGT